MEGFEFVLKTTNRKEGKDIVDNEPLKSLRGRTKKGNEYVGPSNRGGLASRVGQIKGFTQFYPALSTLTQ